MWRPLSDLVESDLLAHPVWEWSDDAGQPLVRPSSVQQLTEYRGGPLHIALTRFTCQGNTSVLGFCSPSDASGLDYVQPVILLDSGPIALWPPTALGTSEIQRLAFAFSASATHLFPIRVDCLVPVDGKYYSATVDAI